MDVYLDSGLIPSLSGNSVPHHALMGRPILPLQATTISGAKTRPSNSSSSLDTMGSMSRQDTAVQASEGRADITRSSSLPRKVPDRSTSRVRDPGPPAHPLVLGSSSTSITANFSSIRDGSGKTSDTRLVRSPAIPAGRQHTRSTSETLSTRDLGINLLAHSESGDASVVDLLTRLHDLIPPSRLDPLAPLPSSGILHPPTVLAGLAFVLSALVLERTLLLSSAIDADVSFEAKDSVSLRDPCHDTQMQLPLLRDRSSLQLKTGSLDWSAFKSYIAQFSSVIQALIGILMSSELTESGVTLIETIRVYINKISKVFAEIARLYTDKYSFVHGCWDEGGMRGSAAEVGDLLKAVRV